MQSVSYFLLFARGITAAGAITKNSKNELEVASPTKALLRKEQLFSHNLNNLLPQCYYINLANRTDRRQRLESELKKTDISCTRVEASTPLAKEQPTDACKRSHLQALRKLKESGAQFGLILEDDAVWNQTSTKVTELLSHVHDSIASYPVIMLACHNVAGHHGLPSKEPWIRYAQDCLTTSAYIIRQDYISKLTDLWTKDAGIMDVTWQRLQQVDKWGMTDPLLVVQGASYSDIEHKPVDYGVVKVDHRGAEQKPQANSNENEHDSLGGGPKSQAKTSGEENSHAAEEGSSQAKSGEGEPDLANEEEHAESAGVVEGGEERANRQRSR